MPVKAWLSEVPAPTNTNGVVSLQCCFYFSLLSINIYLVTQTVDAILRKKKNNTLHVDSAGSKPKGIESNTVESEVSS